MYNILTQFLIPMELVRLIKMCLNETYSTVRLGKHLSDLFPIKNDLKKGDALSPLLFNFALEYTILKFQVNQDGLKLNGRHQLLVHDNDVNIKGRRVYIVKKNTESLVIASKEIRLEVNAEKTKYMVMSREQTEGQNHSIKTVKNSFERLEDLRYLGTTLMDQNSIEEEIKNR